MTTVIVTAIRDNNRATERGDKDKSVTMEKTSSLSSTKRKREESDEDGDTDDATEDATEDAKIKSSDSYI